jgi:hypothetical protein
VPLFSCNSMLWRFDAKSAAYSRQFLKYTYLHEHSSSCHPQIKPCSFQHGVAWQPSCKVIKALEVRHGLLELGLKSERWRYREIDCWKGASGLCV